VALSTSTPLSLRILSSGKNTRHKCTISDFTIGLFMDQRENGLNPFYLTEELYSSTDRNREHRTMYSTYRFILL